MKCDEKTHPKVDEAVVERVRVVFVADDPGWAVLTGGCAFSSFSGSFSTVTVR